MSCNRGDSEVSFRLPFEQSYRIDKSIGVSFPIDFESDAMPTQLDSALLANGTSADLITGISIDYAELQLDTPVAGDLSFLRSIICQISAENLPPKDLAYLNPIPEEAPQNQVLNTSSQAFKDYLTKDQFRLNTRCITDEFMDEDHFLRLRLEFVVRANVLN